MKYLHAAVACVLLLVCHATAYAIRPPSTPARASFKVTGEFYNGVASGGSSTAIHPRLVVTNAHVCPQMNERVTLVNEVTGERAVGIVFAVDSDADLAFINPDRDVSYVPCEWEIDGRRMQRYCWGGTSGRFAKIECSLKRKRNVGTHQELILTRPSVSGDSGSGVFENGKLVAVLHSTNNNESWNPNDETYATPARYIGRLAYTVDVRHNSGLFPRLFPCIPYRGQPQPRRGYGYSNPPPDQAPFRQSVPPIDFDSESVPQGTPPDT